jgi:hypothetical protein
MNKLIKNSRTLTKEFRAFERHLQKHNNYSIIYLIIYIMEANTNSVIEHKLIVLNSKDMIN